MDENDEQIKKDLEKALGSNKASQVARFALAVISGAIPLAGGLVSAVSGSWSESEQNHFKEILAKWLRLQEDEIKEISSSTTRICLCLFVFIEKRSLMQASCRSSSKAHRADGGYQHTVARRSTATAELILVPKFHLGTRKFRHPIKNRPGFSLGLGRLFA